MFDDQTSEAQSKRPSREEIETLCLLRVIGPDGCGVGELALRLGITSRLAKAVDQAVHSLVPRGLVALVADRFVMTEAGAQHVEEQLARFL